jgi:hypothetical protein
MNQIMSSAGGLALKVFGIWLYPVAVYAILSFSLFRVDEIVLDRAAFDKFKSPGSCFSFSSVALYNRDGQVLRRGFLETLNFSIFFSSRCMITLADSL